MIVNKPDGWYVQSEKGRHLGGPFQTYELAQKRLAQCEAHAEKSQAVTQKISRTRRKRSR